MKKVKKNKNQNNQNNQNNQKYQNYLRVQKYPKNLHLLLSHQVQKKEWVQEWKLEERCWEDLSENVNDLKYHYIVLSRILTNSSHSGVLGRILNVLVGWLNLRI